MTQLPVLQPRQPTCSLCDLSRGIKSPGIPARSLSQPNTSLPAVIVLGQNPGFFENEAGENFIGKTGKFVTSFCEGMARRASCSIYLLNTARCFTDDERPPTIKQFTTCFCAYSKLDITSIVASHPRTAIVCLGAAAAHAVWCFLNNIKKSPPFDELRTRQATTFNHLGRPLTFFCTYHPAAAARHPPLRFPISEHLQLPVLWLLHQLPTRSNPHIVPPRPPCTTPRTSGG